MGPRAEIAMLNSQKCSFQDFHIKLTHVFKNIFGFGRKRKGFLQKWLVKWKKVKKDLDPMLLQFYPVMVYFFFKELRFHGERLFVYQSYSYLCFHHFLYLKLSVCNFQSKSIR